MLQMLEYILSIGVFRQHWLKGNLTQR
jgi:hypothetical protein